MSPFDPDLFKPEVLAQLPEDVKTALVELTRASVEVALLTVKKGPTTSALRNQLDSLSLTVANSSLAYGRALLRAYKGRGQS